MPKHDLILNLPGFSIAKVSGYQPLLLDVISKRNSYLEQQPAIAAIYNFKQELHQLLSKKHCAAKECR